MNAIYTNSYKTPMGELILGVYGKELCLCDWQYRKSFPLIAKRLTKYYSAEFVEKNDSLLEQTKTQLDEYFRGDRKSFDLPIKTIGTDFQKLVWQQLLSIPYGTTTNYKEIAKSIDNPLSVRAVATANGANCLTILIPCHRVIGSDGSLVGYAGGLNSKKKLLQLEKKTLP